MKSLLRTLSGDEGTQGGGWGRGKILLSLILLVLLLSPGIGWSSAEAPTAEGTEIQEPVETGTAAVQSYPHENVEYRKFPKIGSRVAIWVAAQLHLLFGAFVLAVPMFAFIIQLIGFIFKDKRYDRLAYEFVKLLSVSFSFTAALGALLTFLLLILYPKLMQYMVAIFSWTYIPYALLFIAEAVFLYSYYYGWNKIPKVLHLFLGLGLNIVGIGILFIANSWVTFMNSPGGVAADGALISMSGAFQNFTWMPLNIHRLIANMSFGGSIAAAYGAYRFISSSTPEQRAHYDWMGHVGNFVAISAFLPLSFAGYWYGKEIYDYSQNLGMVLMGGAFSWLFILQAILIGFLFLAANYYLWLGMGRLEKEKQYRAIIKYLLGALVICFIIWATPHSLVASAEEARKMGGMHHPLLGVLGVMSAKNVAVNIMILATYLSFLLYRRGSKVPRKSWVKTGNMVQYAILGIVSAYVIYLGIIGYFVEASVRISLSIPQVLSVVFGAIAVEIIETIIYKSPPRAPAQWGKIPLRAQYILFFNAITFTWTMGLMGYARAGMRQHWHVYGVIRDRSPDAFTPTLGFASIVVSVTTLIFFIFIAAVFWLSSLSGDRVVEEKAVR